MRNDNTSFFHNETSGNSKVGRIPRWTDSLCLSFYLPFLFHYYSRDCIRVKTALYINLSITAFLEIASKYVT